MQRPRPVNLMTPQESRALGWAAESRDKDGHLVTQHAPFESFIEMIDYIRKERNSGHTVTIWPHESGV
jgi:hypothetical protein